MEKLKKEEVNRIVSYFKESKDTLIWSCLQGYMGEAWVDDKEQPKSVQIITGDFCFFGGEPTKKAVAHIPESYRNEYLLVVPENETWENILEETYRERAHRFMRYAIKKEKDVFDKECLQSYVEALPEKFRIQVIDEKYYNQILEMDWCRDLCSQFLTYEDYEQRGLGFVVVAGEEIVSGASSYTIYQEGIEIEIDTRADYRRQGLALACAAKLILTTLEKGLYPSWDAANKGSVALAEKLGYHFDKEYTTYAIKVAETE